MKYIYKQFSVYIYIYIWMYVCVCIFVFLIKIITHKLLYTLKQLIRLMSENQLNDVIVKSIQMFIFLIFIKREIFILFFDSI
jgi:hypothetical protein